MIFEEIINNKYKIISKDQQIQETHREELKKLLQNKKKLKENKEIFLQLKKEKVTEIEILIQDIDNQIKKISENYKNIFIQDI